MNMILAVDVGFGRTKAVSEKHKINFPSLIDYFKKIPFAGVSEMEKIRKLAVGYNGNKYFVGDMAKVQGIPQATLNSARFLDDEGMVLLLTAMLLVGQGEDKIKLVVGLPVHDYARLKSEYRYKLKGKHELRELTIGGQTTQKHVFDIVDLRIMPQPFGSLLYRIFDGNGATISKNHKEEMIGIVDIGYYTVDLALVNSMEFIGRQSISLNNFGINSVFTELSSDIYSQHGIELMPEKMDEVVRNRQVKIKGEKTSVDRVVDDVIKNHAHKIALQVSNRWNLNEIDRIFISGGGAHLLGSNLSKIIDHKNVEISDQGMYTNVLGYYRYGVTTFQKKRIG